MKAGVPIPATYILDRDGTVLFATANEDYTERPEPAETVRVLNANLEGLKPIPHEDLRRG